MRFKDSIKIIFSGFGSGFSSGSNEGGASAFGSASSGIFCYLSIFFKILSSSWKCNNYVCDFTRRLEAKVIKWIWFLWKWPEQGSNRRPLRKYAIAVPIELSGQSTKGKLESFQSHRFRVLTSDFIKLYFHCIN